MSPGRRLVESAVVVAFASALPGACVPVGTVVLLPEKEGRGASVVVQGNGTRVVLDQPYAAADLTTALALDPRLASAHNALAAVQLRQGREADAIASWQTALELNPRMNDALYNLCTVLVKAGRRDEARPYLERFIREAPRSRYDADIKRIEPLLAR